MALFSKTKEKKQNKDLLEKLKKKRDLAIKFRKNTDWDGRYITGMNYYQFGVAENLVDQTLKKRKRRKANYVFSNIESMVPKIFDRLPSFQVLPRGKEDNEKAPIVEEVLRYKFQRLGIEQLFEDVIRDMLIKSLGVMKVTWETRLKKDNKAKEEDKIQAVIKDDILVEVIDPWHLWITAGDRRFDEAEGVFEKMLVHPNEAEIKYGKKFEADHSVIDSKQDDPEDVLKDEVGRVSIWQYHGILDGDKKVYTFTDKELLSTDEFSEHGRFPYIILPNYRQSHEFYPWSEVYQIEPLQQELIEIDNQSSEFRKRAINPKKVVKKGSIDEINMARLKDPRINVIETNDINGIQWESPSLIGQDIYNMRAIKKEDIGLMTGQNELSRGGTERTVKTATGQQILFDAAQGRIRQKVRILEAAIKELLVQIQGLLAENLDKEEVVKITENEEDPFVNYTKEDIQGNFDYMIDMVETMPILREKRGQLALQAFQLFANDPDFDQRLLKQKVIKLAFQDINAEELMKPEEQQEELPIEQQPIGGEQLPPLPQAPPAGGADVLSQLGL